MNLFSNARDTVLNNQGEMKIESKLYTVEDEVYLSVKDNGSGIPQEIMKKIFDPSFTTKGVNKGTGIGLSITHKIMEDHRGRIDVQSEQNKYTIFQLILPLAQAAQEPTSKAS